MMHYVLNEGLEGVIEPSVKSVERNPISEEWRGWNYYNQNLRTEVDDVKLPIYAVAAKYCSSGRDVYLRFVKRLRPEVSEAMIEGILYHSILSEIVENSRKYIFSRDLDGKFNIGQFLFFRGKEVIDRLLKGEDVRQGLKKGTMKQKDLVETKANLEKLWSYEATLIQATVSFYISKHPYINKDSLSTRAMPIVVEQKLDGSKLGLSSNLSADAVHLPGRTIVLDVKTGRKKDFHRLTTTGYALVLESIEKRPVDVGVITYPTFNKNRSVPSIEMDVHPISDKLRRQFIEERNKKLKIVAEKTDPLHEDGKEWCAGCALFRND